jgi:hypothetical protein
MEMRTLNHWFVLAVVLCAYILGGYFDSMAY